MENDGMSLVTSDPAAAPPAHCDIVFRHGTVIDGSGTPGIRADVAVDGGKIVAVGDLAATRAEWDIDAGNRVIAPGFIDVHTHDDRAMLSGPDMAPKVSQGVTTVVVGNCGFSLAPLTCHGRPPAPLDLLGDETWFVYDSFGDYLDRLEAKPAAVNAVCLVGHMTLRVGAMDDLDRSATEDEIALMGERLEQSLDAGAAGLSTGLHYPAGHAASTEEVIALTRRLANNRGLYVTHMRNEADDVEKSLVETFRIGRETGVPVLISHHKVIGPANFGRSVQTLARIEQAMTEQDVSLDLYPYTAGSTVLDPGRCDGRMRVLVTWSVPFPEQTGRDIADIAADWHCPPVEAAKRLLPAGAIYFMLDEGDVQRILHNPHTMIGSDGLPHDSHPHPRLWGTFPRVLGHYARDLGLLSLEEAVHRMTGLPAGRFGLSERGAIRPGYVADMVMFDPLRVIDRSTYEDPTVPADGIDLVLVDGTPVWQQGKTTGARPGHVLRRG